MLLHKPVDYIFAVNANHAIVCVCLCACVYLCVCVSVCVCMQDVTLDDEALDPSCPFTLLLHKPIDYVVSSPEDKNISGASTVYDLLPYR